MNKNIALMALTGVLTLASCGQNQTPTCTTDQTLVNNVCTTVTGTVTYNNTQDGTVTLTNSAGSTVTGTTNLPLGNYVATLSKDGFDSTTQSFTLTAAAPTATVTFSNLVAKAVPGAQTGSLIINGMQAGEKVVIKDGAGVVVPMTGSTLSNLVPGSYTATFSQDGYSDATSNFGIVAGVTTQLTAPNLTKTAASAYYLKNGVRTALPSSFDASKFRFSAWLENRADGIDPAKLGAGNAAPQTAAKTELTEFAPSGSQNIVAAYMEYNDGGTWYPVVGAEVRMDLKSSALTDATSTTDENYAGQLTAPNPTDGTAANRPLLTNAQIAEVVRRGNSIGFVAADDSGLDSGATVAGPLDINAAGKSVVTWTNGTTGNVAFPNRPGSEYPMNNLTGVVSPDVAGFTWAALQDDRLLTYRANGGAAGKLDGRMAQARIVAVGYVNGNEVNKVWLEKNFVPAALPTITKTVIGGDVAKIGESKSFRITITNNSPVAMNSVNMSDVLLDATQSPNYGIRGVVGKVYTGTEYNSTGQYQVDPVTGFPVGATVTAVPNASILLTGNDVVKDDGFSTSVASQTGSFNIPAYSVATFDFDVVAKATGKYCDRATLNGYFDNNIGDINGNEDNSTNRGVFPSGLYSEACMNVVPEPKLAVKKEIGLMINNVFVPFSTINSDPQYLSYRRVNPDQAVIVKVTTTNNGTERLTNVTTTDSLTSANAATHYIVGTPTTTSGTVALNGDDGFTTTIPALAPGASNVTTFQAAGSARGKYCDSVTSVGTATATDSTTTQITAPNASACFSVDVTRFTKVNSVIRNGKLVNVENVDNIARDELILTTITLENDADTMLDNVRLYDILGIGQNNPAAHAIYEDRRPVITLLGAGLKNDDGTAYDFDRVDAYDAKTGALGKLTAGKFVTVGDMVNNTALVATAPGAGTGRQEQAINDDALRQSVVGIRSDDTTVNAGVYNPGASANFDETLVGSTYIRNTPAEAIPGYSLRPGQQLTLRFWNRLPAQLKADNYCNTAWWNYGSLNTPTATKIAGYDNRIDEVTKCVNVQRAISFKHDLNDFKGAVDTDDFAPNETITYLYRAYVEISSTQGAKNNVFTMTYGTQSTAQGGGVFNIDKGATTAALYNADGTVANPAVAIVGNVFNATNATRVVTIDPSVIINPGQHIEISTNVAAPAGTASGIYASNVDWNSVGELDNKAWQPQSQASDPTTITNR